MITNVEISELPVRPCSEIEELRGDFSICDYLRRNVNMFTGPDADIELMVGSSVIRMSLSASETGFSLRQCPTACPRYPSTPWRGRARFAGSAGFNVEELKVIGPESIRLAMAKRASAAAEAYSE
jgi:hypothetical protein